MDLGDLTWNTEVKLVRPTNKVGPIDVYLTTHHGLNASNNPVVIRSVEPKVAIFNNGPRKGGHPDVTTALRAAGVIDIWQLHRNVTVGAELNTQAERIANHEEQCKGEYLKLSVAPDAKTYTVQIGPTGTPRIYATRSREVRR
jgi:beta-lactamase superfamily II metal-dependent hydrolase